MTCKIDSVCEYENECENLQESMPSGNGLKGYDPFREYIISLIQTVWDNHHPGAKCITPTKRRFW